MRARGALLAAAVLLGCSVAGPETEVKEALARLAPLEVAAGGGIRHKREAEWIAAQVLAALAQARRA